MPLQINQLGPLHLSKGHPLERQTGYPLWERSGRKLRTEGTEPRLAQANQVLLPLKTAYVNPGQPHPIFSVPRARSFSPPSLQALLEPCPVPCFPPSLKGYKRLIQNRVLFKVLLASTINSANPRWLKQKRERGLERQLSS